jgi:hypothetical protein
MRRVCFRWIRISGIKQLTTVGGKMPQAGLLTLRAGPIV